MSVPLRDSPLWQLQDETYHSFGPEAWSKKGVPFYITSMPLIASQYAECVAKWAGNRKISVVSLGCGSGRFDYLCVRELQKLLGDRFHYIATDMVESNLERLASHPMMLDLPIQFSQYNPLTDEAIPGYEGGPLAVVANYLFDTIQQDRFRVENGTLLQGLVELSPSRQVTYSYEPCNNPYTGTTGEVLDWYAKKYRKATFLLPTGAFTVINRLRALTDSLLLISGDQGVATQKQVEEWEPDIDWHGSFSMPVDLLAIREYAKRTGGKTLLTKNPDPLFVIQASSWPAKKLHDSFSKCEPIHYWREQNGCKPEQIVPLCRKGRGDPIFLHEHHHELLKRDTPTDLLLMARANFFPISPEESGVYTNIGVLLFKNGEDAESIRSFEMALEWNPDDKVAAKNLKTFSK